MASGIFTVLTKSNEVKGKDVDVTEKGIILESGEVIDFKDVFATFVGSTVNFSIKVTEKDEMEFTV
jgi:hypothetical protein